MSLIERGNIIENAVAILTGLGVPVNGTSAVQTLTVTGAPTGGTIPLSIYGETASVPYNATAAQVQSALTGLSSVGGNVTASSGPLPTTPVIVTFTGALANLVVPLIAAGSAALTGGTGSAASFAMTTPGVTATGRTSRTGQVYEDGTPATGEFWQNQGVAPAPSWVKVGTQV